MATIGMPVAQGDAKHDRAQSPVSRNMDRSEVRSLLSQLSPLEKAAAIHVAFTLEDKEIARSLQVSETTATKALVRARIKLGCVNRLQIALLVHGIDTRPSQRQNPLEWLLTS